MITSIDTTSGTTELFQTYFEKQEENRKSCSMITIDTAESTITRLIPRL
jgi:hypothetical protein